MKSHHACRHGAALDRNLRNAILDRLRERIPAAQIKFIRNVLKTIPNLACRNIRQSSFCAKVMRLSNPSDGLWRFLQDQPSILQETNKIVGAKNCFSQGNLTTFNKEKNTIFAGKRSRVWEKMALEVRDRCRHALLRDRRASSAAPFCSRDRSQNHTFIKPVKTMRSGEQCWLSGDGALRLPRSMPILPTGVPSRSD